MTDADLQRLIAAWLALPEEVRADIMAIIDNRENNCSHENGKPRYVAQSDLASPP